MAASSPFSPKERHLPWVGGDVDKGTSAELFYRLPLATNADVSVHLLKSLVMI